jgi:hypothetical protein
MRMEIFFEQLTFRPSTDTSFGVYISQKNLLTGNSYTIEATYKDLPIISANQKVPAEPEISNIEFGKDFSQINDVDTLPVKITFHILMTPLQNILQFIVI